jgi:hypothetical protein
VAPPRLLGTTSSSRPSPGGPSANDSRASGSSAKTGIRSVGDKRLVAISCASSTPSSSTSSPQFSCGLHQGDSDSATGLRTHSSSTIGTRIGSLHGSRRWRPRRSNIRQPAIARTTTRTSGSWRTLTAPSVSGTSQPPPQLVISQRGERGASCWLTSAGSPLSEGRSV